MKHITFQVIVQIVLLAMQGINKIYNLLPPKGKNLAAGAMLILQAFIALRNLWTNPDGTPAKLPYFPENDSLMGLKTGLKGLILLCLFLLIPAPSMAQEHGFTLSLAYNQNGSPQLLGMGAYDREISANFHNVTGYTAAPIKQDGKTKLKFTAFTGVIYDLPAIIGKLTFHLKGAGGVATTGNVTTGSGIFGGFARYPIGIASSWCIQAGAEGAYGPINGTDAVLSFGIRYGGK